MRFPFLGYPLDSFRQLAQKLPPNAHTKLREHLSEADYSVRLLRYWWAGQALRKESERLGRPLQVVDLGCERGWLKHFTPEGVVSRWIGLDWNPQREVSELAGYDEVHHANFDDTLPLPGGVADAVVSLHVFEHLPRPGATMAEVSRLLKPGGIFLGGAPTMPDWLARLREKYFRKQLRAGKLAAGGHITVLSPKRWRSLAADTGLETEFVTGSHAFRRTGSLLESQRWWIRMNQFWGGLFPALGSEAYTMARRSQPWVESTDRLTSVETHWRKGWIALGAAAGVALLGLTAWLASSNPRPHRELMVWLDAQQRGEDVFLVTESVLNEITESREDTHFVATAADLDKSLAQTPDAHVLVSLDAAMALAGEADANHTWRIDSRLDLNQLDFLLLKRSSNGTPLNEYLLGALDSKGL